MPQQNDAQLQSILSLTREIKTMLAAERRQSELSSIVDHLGRLDHQHEAIRADLREVLLQLAQSATGAD